jgi:betaine-aldehyde dehydrogenase
MGIANFFRPKYKHSDVKVRLEAVRALTSDETDILATVARSDKDAGVRRVAIEKLDEVDVLAEIATRDDDRAIRDLAGSRASELWITSACQDEDEELAKTALSGLLKLGDQRAVAEVAGRAADRAVRQQALAALNGPYPQLSAEERAEWLRKLSGGIQARAQELADVITAEMGSPASWSIMGQVFSATMVLDSFADLLPSFAFEEHRAGAFGPVLVRKEPVGVSVGIVPWNVPLFVGMLKLAPALAAGSPIILKPSPETPLDGYLLGEVIDEIGLPKGMVSILPAGREVGEYMVRHRGVSKVSFTGSTAAGRKVGAACGELLKRFTLELGGKSAAILLDDADLAAQIPMLMPNSLMNNGEACVAQTRILAPRSRYSEVVEAVAAAVEGTTVVDPSDQSNAVGPLVAERQRDRLLGYIE